RLQHRAVGGPADYGGGNGDRELTAALGAGLAGAAAVVGQGGHGLSVEPDAVEGPGRGGGAADRATQVGFGLGEVDLVVELPGGQPPDVVLHRVRAGQAGQAGGGDVHEHVGAVPDAARAGQVE